MVTFNAGNNSPTYGGVYVIGIRNNHLYSGRASYNHLEIMERNMLDANPTPTTLFEVEDYIGYFRMSQSRRDITIYGANDRSRGIPIVCLDDSASKWILLDCDGKVFFIQKNEGKQLIPSEGCDEIFLKCHSKYSMNHTQTLFIDYGRIYLLRSSHEHDLYEIEINEKHFTFKAIRIGRIDDMHTDVHHKILVTNEMAISVFQDICMYGFFRVPRLGELAFIKIQKMLSKKFKGDDCGRFEAYKGGISEEGLKKMIGLDAGKSLLPLLG
uniref:Uncharacterized protein n=1 Tax=Acrobeloides nanus TaxID=290746 RepID=A0A914CDL4_9BILA